MKKFRYYLFGILLSVMFLSCLCSCASTTDNEYNSLSSQHDLNNFSRYGQFAKLGSIVNSSFDFSERLFYDTYTKIVYLEGYDTFTPYLAPNGLPYRYNEETNELEEIKENEEN